ncbi:MAG TPA: DUF488 family protein [Candidatus Babeliales bacterium]|jgi:hypothetical protein|nr:DUF488 family protein [Candidatus Babeliales bacterium]
MYESQNRTYYDTHTMAEFIAILQAFGIQKVVDIRTIAKSRHNPQFNKTTAKPHYMTPFAYVEGINITYPSPDED